jgi:two-component system, OmpR family, response regulator
MSRILVVEDESAIAELVAINLRHAGFDVCIAETADAAQAEVDRVLPDLVVLDWMLPGRTGLALAGHWRSVPRTRELPIIMLTARAQEADKLAGLDAGADDYLTKPFAAAELLARVRALTRREAAERPASLRVGDLVLDPATREVHRGDTPIALSAKEFALLHELMRRHGETLSRTYLIDHVWDFAYDGGSNVVDVYIRYLRDKVDRPFGRGTIQTVRGAGYRLDPSS